MPSKALAFCTRPWDFCSCFAVSTHSPSLSFPTKTWSGHSSEPFSCFLPACPHVGSVCVRARVSTHVHACSCTFICRLQIFHLALTLCERDKEMFMVSAMLCNSLEPVSRLFCTSYYCLCINSSGFCPSSAINLLCNFWTCISPLCALFTIMNKNRSQVLLIDLLLRDEGNGGILSAGHQWFLCKIKHCEKSCSPHPSIHLSSIGQSGQVPLILWQENLSSWVCGDQVP